MTIRKKLIRPVKLNHFKNLSNQRFIEPECCNEALV